MTLTTYTIAKLIDHVQLKLISADSGTTQNVYVNDSDITIMSYGNYTTLLHNYGNQIQHGTEKRSH